MSDEVDPGTPVVPQGMGRRAQARVVGPAAHRLARAGVSASAVTVVGLGLGLACGVAAWRQAWALAAVLWVAASACDLLDGPLARAAGTAGGAGARLDTMCDRLVDAAPLVGMAVGGSHTVPALCVLAVVWMPAAVGQLGDRAGVAARGGPMGRPQRAVLQLVVLAVPPAAAVALWAMVAGTLATVAVRLVRWSVATA